MYIYRYTVTYIEKSTKPKRTVLLNYYQIESNIHQQNSDKFIYNKTMMCTQNAKTHYHFIDIHEHGGLKIYIYLLNGSQQSINNLPFECVIN